jgi:hypothetical protein
VLLFFHNNKAICIIFALQLAARDEDAGVNGRVEYTVKSRRGRFSIHPDTGVVYAHGPVQGDSDYDLLVSLLGQWYARTL